MLKKKRPKIIHLNRAVEWQRKVDDFFNLIENSRKTIGIKADRGLTIAMVASLIILALTVTYVLLTNRGGPTNWAIWLYDIDIDTLVEAKQEIVVINYSKDSAGDSTGENMFSPVETARIKASGKQLYAYLAIPDNYWETSLTQIITDIAKAGFDGVYLTNIEAYQRWQNEQAATILVNQITELATTARAQNSKFQIFLGDGYEILANEPLWDIINGVGMESLFFENGEERSEENINYDLAILDQVTAADKLVLVIEYDLTDKKQTSKLCSQTHIRKYIPGIAPSNLNWIDPEKVCK